MRRKLGMQIQPTSPALRHHAQRQLRAWIARRGELQHFNQEAKRVDIFRYI